MRMFKVGMIGDYDSAIGFKAVGIDTYVVKDAKEAENILASLVREGYGIVFITEEIATSIENAVDSVNRETSCSVLIIPSVRGSTGFAIDKIRRNVEKAVGIDIFKSS